MGGLAFLAPDKLRPYLWYRGGGGYTGSVTIRPSVRLRLLQAISIASERLELWLRRQFTGTEYSDDL